MLYLIQVSDSETNQRLLKIGYSDNWQKRRQKRHPDLEEYFEIKSLLQPYLAKLSVV